LGAARVPIARVGRRIAPPRARLVAARRAAGSVGRARARAPARAPRRALHRYPARAATVSRFARSPPFGLRLRVRCSGRPTKAPRSYPMNTDLTMLTASTVLLALLVSGKGVAMWMYWPVAEVLGNRENPPPLPAWAWRADRAHRNMLENFPHFAVLVLLVYVTGLSNR